MGNIEPVTVSAEIGATQPDGGLYLSIEDLKRLGHGDAKNGRRWIRMAMADEIEPKVHSGPTERPATIRIAGEADEVHILAMLIKHLRSAAGHIVPIDPERVLKHIQIGTRRKGGIVGVIDGPEGLPVAVTVLIPAQSAVSQAYHIQVVFNYVHPDHRRSRHGEDLVRFERWCSDDWSRGFGYPVPVVHMLHTEDNLKEKIRFYRRWMNQIGAVFAYPFPN